MNSEGITPGLIATAIFFLSKSKQYLYFPLEAFAHSNFTSKQGSNLIRWPSDVLKIYSKESLIPLPKNAPLIKTFLFELKSF